MEAQLRKRACFAYEKFFSGKKSVAMARFYKNRVWIGQKDGFTANRAIIARAWVSHGIKHSGERGIL